MTRIDFKSNKFNILVGLLFSTALAFLVLREFLLSPGILESIDIQWNNYVAMFQMFFHTWNFYNNGSNIIFVSQFPLYSLVLVIRDVAMTQRLVYFIIVSLVGFNMFLATFFSLKVGENSAIRFLGSIASSFIYTINPFVFSEIFHISFLWSYSLFPLVYYFTLRSLKESSRRKVVTSSLLLSVFFAFMTDAWGMVVAFLLFLIVALSTIVLNGLRGGLKSYASNLLLTLSVMFLVTPLLAAYWLMPFLMQRPSEPSWLPFSVTNLFANSQDSSLGNILGLHAWNSQPFFSPSQIGQVMFNVWLVFTLALPIIATSAVLLRRNKTTFTLSFLLIVSAFLAKGVQPPFGEFYLWLSFLSPRIVPNQTFLFKYPYLFIANISLAYGLLSAVLVMEAFGRSKFPDLSWRPTSSANLKRLPVVAFISIMLLTALAGAPLLTGNLNGALKPVSLPEQYIELNQFLSSQGGTFRVMWLPETTEFLWSPNPFVNKIEYWGSGVPPLMYGWGIVASPYMGFLGNLIYDYLSNNQTFYLGKILALANVKYIVFHNDTVDFAQNSYMLRNLLNQKDLKLAFFKGGLFAFENTDVSDYFRALKKVTFVVGGMDIMPSLSSLDDFHSDESAFIFLERQHTSMSDLTSILESQDLHKALLFYGNKTFDDFVLDTIEERTLIAPSDLFTSTSPLSDWFRDSVNSHTWTRIALSEYTGEKYDFSLDKNLLSTSTDGAKLSFNTQIDKTGDYDVWVRLLFNPNGGKIFFSISDADFLKEVDSSSSFLQGFKWVRLGTAHLNVGMHEVSITNGDGFNAVNLLAFPTVEMIEEHRRDLQDLIKRSSATIAYVMDKPLLNSLQTPENRTHITVQVPENSSYAITVIADPDSKGTTLNIRVDEKEFVVDPGNASHHWNTYSIGPINLSRGSHDIFFYASSSLEIEKSIVYSATSSNNATTSLRGLFGNSIAYYVTGHEKVDATTFSVTINTSNPFILAFQEPYDEFWQSDAPARKIVLNGLLNGFFVKGRSGAPENGPYKINVAYTPETYFLLGAKVSVLTFVLTVVTASVILTSTKFQRRKRQFSPFWASSKTLKTDHIK